MLPQPHFSIKDSKLFTVKSNVSNEFAEIKEVKIFIKQNNFFDKNNLSISKIDIYRANFFIKRDDFKFISYFFNKEFSKKKIKIKKSKIFFNDKKDNVLVVLLVPNAMFVLDVIFILVKPVVIVVVLIFKFVQTYIGNP